MPPNILIIGDRGSGKSSLLNMIAHYCLRVGYLVARVSLDERLASDDVVFFLELFDGLMEAAHAAGYIRPTEGTGDSLYDSWRRQIDLADTTIPESVPRLRFGQLLPHEARHSRASRLTEALLHQDLQQFIAVLKPPYPDQGRPVCILIDEGDTLASNVRLSQRIRNVLCVAPHYFVILAVTPAGLQRTESSFSPLARSFAAVVLSPFETLEETRECIERPLRKAFGEIDIPERFVAEVHRLTSGHPYLIQLTYHTWLKRQTRGQESLRFALDIELLQELWHLSQILPHPAMQEFWRGTRDFSP